MSIETYEDMFEVVKTDAAIYESETELLASGQLHEATEALAILRRKHFG